MSILSWDQLARIRFKRLDSEEFQSKWFNSPTNYFLQWDCKMNFKKKLVACHGLE